MDHSAIRPRRYSVRSVGSWSLIALACETDRATLPSVLQTASRRAFIESDNVRAAAPALSTVVIPSFPVERFGRGKLVRRSLRRRSSLEFCTFRAPSNPNIDGLFEVFRDFCG